MKGFGRPVWGFRRTSAGTGRSSSNASLMQRTLSMDRPRSAHTSASCAVSKSPARHPVSNPRHLLSSARSRMACAVLTPPTCHRLSRESFETMSGSEWFSPKTRSPALRPGCRPPAKPAEIKSPGYADIEFSPETSRSPRAHRSEKPNADAKPRIVSCTKTCALKLQCESDRYHCELVFLITTFRRPPASSTGPLSFPSRKETRNSSRCSAGTWTRSLISASLSSVGMANPPYDLRSPSMRTLSPFNSPVVSSILASPFQAASEEGVEQYKRSSREFGFALGSRQAG